MKYEGNKAVVDEPSIWRISNNSVTVLKAGGTESFSYEGDFIMQIGDIQAYAPIDIEPEDVPDITPVTPTPNPGSEDNPGGGGESGGESGSGSGGSSEGGDNPGEGESGGETPPTSDPIIYLKLRNECGNEVRLDGEAILNIYNSPTSSQRIEQNVHMYGAHSADWVSNRSELTIPIGGSYTWHATVDATYLNGNYYILKDTTPYPNDYVCPIHIYSTYYNKNKQKKDHGNGMYFANIETCKLQRNTEATPYIFTIYAMNSEALVANTNTTISSLNASAKKYAILLVGQTSLPQ